MVRPVNFWKTSSSSSVSGSAKMTFPTTRHAAQVGPANQSAKTVSNASLKVISMISSASSSMTGLVRSRLRGMALRRDPCRQVCEAAIGLLPDLVQADAVEQARHVLGLLVAGVDDGPHGAALADERLHLREVDVQLVERHLRHDDQVDDEETLRGYLVLPARRRDEVLAQAPRFTTGMSAAVEVMP